jgi:oligosaccharyltransferase complex subunit delta (ribophorin II)
MYLWQATTSFCLLASAALPTVAASAWGFTDATVAVQPKGAGINGGFKEQYAPITLPSSVSGTNSLLN